MYFSYLSTQFLPILLGFIYFVTQCKSLLNISFESASIGEDERNKLLTSTLNFNCISPTAQYYFISIYLLCVYNAFYLLCVYNAFYLFLPKHKSLSISETMVFFVVVVFFSFFLPQCIKFCVEVYLRVRECLSAWEDESGKFTFKWEFLSLLS